jgi:hypothetical protein
MGKGAFGGRLVESKLRRCSVVDAQVFVRSGLSPLSLNRGEIGNRSRELMHENKNKNLRSLTGSRLQL